MDAVRLLIHAPGAPGLRWLGLGPGLRPSRGLWKLQRLLDQHTFWAQRRSLGQLRRMLAGSAAVASLWRGKRLVGFARVSSDGVFRAVLWDVVIPEDLQGQGLGRQLVEALLASSEGACACSPSTLCEPVQKQHAKEVFGFTAGTTCLLHTI